jgi:hypothetical protein
MNSRSFRLAAVPAALLAAGAANAHHGFGNFDRSREVTLEGTITSIDFVNPHAYVYFESTNSDGTKVAKRCEMRAATVLRRSGWSAEMFKPGEPIKIEGAPDRFDVNSCYVHTVLFADGTTADRYAQLSKPAPAAPREPRAARLPSGEPNISGDWAPEQVVMTDPRGRSGSLVPVSRVEEFEPGATTTPAGGSGAPRPRVTYTDAGRAASEAFRGGTTDNPRMRCETTSILFDWTFDGPVNRITQNGDTITLQYGQLGFTRTIHMNMTEHPATIEPSRGGHSIGRWENDVLVVDTVGFAPGYLNPPIPNSDQLHVVERFTLDPDAMTLTREYTATDPVYYTDQYTGRDTIGVADLPYSPDACSELTFVDFSADGLAPDANSGGVGPQGAAAAPAQAAPTAAAPAAEAAAPAAEEEEAAWWEFWKWFD